MSAELLIQADPKLAIVDAADNNSVHITDNTKAEHIRATVILPAYNEEIALPVVLDDLCSCLDDHFEIIVVDDGSADGTAAIANRYPCRLVRHDRNRGKGKAVRTGIQHARGQFVIVMDADATYPVAAVPQIVDLLAEYDLVRCIRQCSGESMPTINRAGNWLFGTILAKIHGLDGADYLSGLYGLRRHVLQQLDLEADGFDIEVEIGIKGRSLGLKEKAFPVVYQPRLGEKKLHVWRDGWCILNRILAMVLLHNPTLTFVYPGVVLLLLGIMGAIILRNASIITPYFGLDVHSFILATLGILAGFQLMVFGMAAALYGVEAGHRTRTWLLDLSSRRLRLGAAGIGVLFSLLAATQIIILISRWLGSGAGYFGETRQLVLASTVLVWGLQVVSAALFLSIFAGRLERLQRTSNS